MLGSIVGDVIGSVPERRPIKTTTFPLIVTRSRVTDDTVLTVPFAQGLMTDVDYGQDMRGFGRRYPHAGYRRSS